MLKKAGLVLSAVIIFFAAFVLIACDPGVGSLPEGYNPYEEAIKEMLKDMDITELLDSEKCYNQLLDDLEFMISDCYYDEQLGSAQAYTILMSYGFADKSQKSSELTSVQLEIKAQLFEEIKLINVYASVFTGTSGFYNSGSVRSHTMQAINYCVLMLSFL